MNVISLLVKVGRALEDASIPYMVIGGQAVLVHGEPRLTTDIDITLGVGIDRFNDIFRLTKKLEFLPVPRNPESFAQKTFVFPAKDEESGLRVDFIFSSTPYEIGAIRRGKRIKMGRMEVNFASVEDLVIHKIFAGRAIDIEDVKGVLLKNPNVDKRYIQRWLKEFDRAVEGSELLKIFQKIVKESLLQSLRGKKFE